MSEIKSTLELALERTKRMAISEEEKEEIRRKEIFRKGSGLFHRYREGHLPLNETLKEIEKIDAKTRARVKEALLSQWIDALSLTDGNERLLKGIEALKHREIEGVKEKLHLLLSHYQKEKEKILEEVKTRWIETLRKEGIDGSAVEPNIESGDLWKKEREKLEQRFGEALEKIKEELRSL